MSSTTLQDNATSTKKIDEVFTFVKVCGFIEDSGKFEFKLLEIISIKDENIRNNILLFKKMKAKYGDHTQIF